MSLPSFFPVAAVASGAPNYDPEFPRDRNEFGLVQVPTPDLMAVTAPAQQASLPGWGRFTLDPGVGKIYSALLTRGMAFGEVGSRVCIFLAVDNPSASYSVPTVRVVASAPFGTQTLNMVQEQPGLWVYVLTVPAGVSSVLLTLTSADAVNPITGNAFRIAVSPAGATRATPKPDVHTMQAWVQSAFADTEGNLWPTEKQSLTVNAGTTAATIRINGITLEASDRVLAMFYLERPDGSPAIFNRVHTRFVSEAPASSQNVFLHPVAAVPGLYAQWFYPTALLGPTVYVELVVNNGSPSPAVGYTQTQVLLKKAALFVGASPPAIIRSPSLLSYNAADGLVVQNYPGMLRVAQPLFSAAGNEFLISESRQYDTTGHVNGGGIGHILEDLYYCLRVGAADFRPVYNLTDLGQWEFAIMLDDGTNQHIGHDVHFGQARRAAPEFRVDGVLQPANARATYFCQTVSWKEFTQLYLKGGVTVFAHLDTTKTWEGRTLKVAHTITFTAGVSLLLIYYFMASFYGNIDNNAANGATFGTVTMPNAGGASYTPGGGVNATYPSQTRFVTTSPFGISFDTEVKSALPPTARSWVQGGSGRKTYFAWLQADSFGLLADRVPLAVTAGTSFSTETWMTASK